MIDLIIAHQRDIIMLTSGAILGAVWMLAVIVRWPWLAFLKHDESRWR